MSAPQTSLRLLLVGPLPPPSGGMANQTRQLKRLLEKEGLSVELVQTNAPYHPAWISSLRGLRAVFRLLPYLYRLFVAMERADVAHVMANSGWTWHLCAAPALWIARLRGTPVIVNYRGGLADEFLDKQGAAVRRSLRQASALVVPSCFLLEVFARHGLQSEIIPNIVDVETFRPAAQDESTVQAGPHLVVMRNLERLYGNDIALQAFAALRHRFSAARLSIAGSGPELARLQGLAQELGVAHSVRFTGRLDTAEVVALYQSADVVLNPTRADNTPNSILEALACGVPVVSTDVGGVPYLVEHARTAWLVRPDAPDETAAGVAHVVDDPELRRTLVANGLALAHSCAWPVVKEQWLSLYRRLASGTVDMPRATRTAT